MSKRKERKEQKLRQELEEQGFSQEEIDKIIQSRNKKQKARIIVTAVVALGVLITSVVVAVKKANNQTQHVDQSEEQRREQEKIQKIIEDNVDVSKISDKESQNNKKELETKKDNQQNSKDIIIPEDATDEEKQELTEKKQDLEMNEKIEDIYNSLYPNSDDETKEGSSSILKIKTIFANSSSSKIFSLIETIDIVNGKYVKFDKLISFDKIDIDVAYYTKSDLIKYISENKSCQTKMISYFENVNSEIIEKVFADNFKSKYDTTEIIIASVDFNSENNLIASIEYLAKLNNEYKFIRIPLGRLLSNVEASQQKEYILNNDISKNVRPQVESLNILVDNSKEQAAAQEEKSGAEAAAFEGMKEIGQNGELIGFDYNKYREFQDEEDAKEQQAQQNKIVEESKLLFPDFDLSL